MLSSKPLISSHKLSNSMGEIESRNTQHQKWEGKVCANLKSPTSSANEVFHLLITDFFHMNKWSPTLITCYGVQGVSGQPGCIRYCAGSSNKPSSSSNGCDSNDDDKSSGVNWCKERLLAVDFVERSFSYDIVDGNLGLHSYVAMMKVMEAKEEENGGCWIEWSFEVDPIQGRKLEDLIAKYDSGLKLMAAKIESNFL